MPDWPSRQSIIAIDLRFDVYQADSLRRAFCLAIRPTQTPKTQTTRDRRVKGLLRFRISKKKVDLLFYFIFSKYTVSSDFKNIHAEPFASIRENIDTKVRTYIPATCEIDERNFQCISLGTSFF